MPARIDNNTMIFYIARISREGHTRCDSSNTKGTSMGARTVRRTACYNTGQVATERSMSWGVGWHGTPADLAFAAEHKVSAKQALALLGREVGLRQLLPQVAVQAELPDVVQLAAGP